MNENPIKDYYEYEVISIHYAGKFARRSKQPYMRHIDQGISMLVDAGADPLVMRAFALHPIVQDHLAFTDYQYELQSCDKEAYELALLFVECANMYLSQDWRGPEDEVPVSNITAVNLMLLVDKMQNAQDLVEFNGDHPRVLDLSAYFANWITALQRVLSGIDNTP